MRDLSKMDIKKFLQIIKGRKYLFIGVSLFVLSVIVWGSFFLPKMYEAKSTVFIERNIIKNLVKGMVVTPSMEDRLRVLTYAMKSRNMLLRVIKALDLDTKAKNPTEMEAMIKNFQDNTKIRVKGNDLFMVSYIGKDPRLARDYVNTLINEYIEENTAAKREETYGANKFLSEQLAYYKKKLEESEKRLSEFRIKKGVYFAADEKSIIQSIKEYNDELEKVRLRIKENEAKRERIKKQLSGEEPLTLAIIDKETDQGGNSLVSRLRLLELKLSLLLTKYTENYPEVIKIKAEIEALKKQIKSRKATQFSGEDITQDLESGTRMMNPVYQRLKEELFNVESMIASLKAKALTLSKRIKRLKTELKNIPEEKKILAALERERNTNRQIYEQLLNRLGQAEVSRQMELEDKGTSFRIIDPAVLPARPISPDRIKFILFGIVAGIASGIGAVLLREHLDHSIRDIDTLKATLSLPLLAVIPKIITEDEILRKKRFDRRIYAISIVYLLVIGGLFIKEVIERFL